MRRIGVGAANAVSMLRVLLSLFFVGLFSATEGWQLNACLAIALVAQLTDHLDGYLARRLGQVSQTGWLIDSFADRTFYVAGVLAYERVYDVNEVIVWFFIIREIALYATKIAIGELKHYRIGAFFHAAFIRIAIILGCVVPYGWLDNTIETNVSSVLNILIGAATISAYVHLYLMIMWWRKSTV